MDKYLIDGHKLYWHLDRVKEWQENRNISPIYIEVSPVSYCNHKCIFCGLDFAQEKKFNLETELFCKQLKEMGKIGVRSIMYSGEGEPLLHISLPKFVQTTKECGMDAAITTNGSLGNIEVWKKILPYLTWIKFSVDAGSPKIYAHIHNVKEGVFKKSINSIRDALKVKNKYNLQVTIGIQFLIMEENLDDIKNAIDLFSDFGIDYFVLKPYSLHPQMKKKKDVIYTPKMLEFIQNIINYYKGKTKIEIIFRRWATEKYLNREKNFNHCYTLPFWGYISSKGDFYTCSIFLGDDRFKVGNIYNESIADIIRGRKRAKSIKYGEKTLNVKKECRVNCRMARANEFLEILNNKPMHVNFI